MQALSTTKMSSRGQIVIPEGVRRQLNLKPGVQFIVAGQTDVVILKRITRPSMKDFDSLIRRARKQARQAGMKSRDVAKAVSNARGRK